MKFSYSDSLYHVCPQVTFFAQYQSTLGDDIRIEQFSLTSEGQPQEGSEALFNSFRLVSRPCLGE